jgi:hypothetical protein
MIWDKRKILYIHLNRITYIQSSDSI